MKAEFNLKREIKNQLVYGKSRPSNVDLHFHSQIEIYFVISGKVEVLLNNSRKVLSQGEGAIAFGYDAHGYRVIDDAEVFYIIIPRNWSSDILPIFDNKTASSQFIKSEKAFLVISDAMEKLCGNRNEILERGYIYVILGTIFDQLTPVTDIEFQNDMFSPEILVYISEHFKEEISLVSLAKRFGYNSSYLSRSFKCNFNISFCKYITMLRLREAVMLITKGELNMTECAIESGFGSMRSFYRAFKEEFGMSPKEYFSK